jgi:tetratricopeptide (TPR) repeat protein
MAGLCHWSLLPKLRGPPARSLGSWGPFNDLGWAQATWCFRRAHLLAPDSPSPLHALYRLFAARGLADAQRTVGQRLLALGQLSADQRAEVRLLSRRLGAVGHRDGIALEELPALLLGLLQGNRPEEAVRLLGQAGARGKLEWDWDLADRLATACMHLGRPELARKLWLDARAPPSPAVRESRLGDTFWVERDFDAALRHYRAARRLQPRLAEPCWALAWLHAQRGEADEALAACRAGLALPVPEPMRAELRALARLLRAHGSKS